MGHDAGRDRNPATRERSARRRRERAEASLEKARDDLERKLDEIARSHAGRPQPQVLDALDRVVARSGVTPRRADLSALAREISEVPDSAQG